MGSESMIGVTLAEFRTESVCEKNSWQKLPGIWKMECLEKELYKTHRLLAKHAVAG